MEIPQLTWIPCVFKSLPLPNLGCPNLQLLPISPILFWRHENHFSGASCRLVAVGNSSIAEVYSKAWRWVNCSGAQMPPHHLGWKQPCSECEGHWHGTEPGHVEALCSPWSGIPRASCTLPTPSRVVPSNPCEFFCVLYFVSLPVLLLLPPTHLTRSHCQRKSSRCWRSRWSKRKNWFPPWGTSLGGWWRSSRCSGTHQNGNPHSWDLSWQLSDALCLFLKLHICCSCNTPVSEKVTSKTWPACPRSNDQS